MTFTEAQLLAWLQQYLWPMLRISSALLIVPVFGSRQLAPRIRMLLALLLTLIIAPLLPAPPAAALFGSVWWTLLQQQIAIGLLIGFTLQLAFEAVTLGAELISASAGLSFAQLADPLRGVTVPVIGQFLGIAATLLFLALGGHLTLIEWLLRSFALMPVGGEGPGLPEAGSLLRFSGALFAGGLLLALPVMIALLAVNLAMGVVSRAAPSLNLFAVGFPISLLVCLVLLYVAMPAMIERMGALFDASWLALRSWMGG